jgi:transposase InsO family protein
MDIDYFTKWDKALPTISKNETIASLFMFNHIITRFGVPRTIVIDHGSHFCNKMMTELDARLGVHHENLTPYYPQYNGQLEANNHVPNTMI